jgi:VanZ family protein
LLIVYGSLYPWHFVPAHLTANPLWILLHSWRPAPLRYLLRDTIVNVTLYIPLGFAAHLVFRQGRFPGFGIYGPVLLGLLLSTAMELIQLLEPTRTTSIADVITNVIGSGLGVMAGLLFEALASRKLVPGVVKKSARSATTSIADRGALMLAFCWIAWLFFPLFPVSGRYVLSNKLAVFEHSRVVEPVLLVSAAASWFAAGLLITAAGKRMSRVWLPLTLLAIPAQFFIVERQPLPSFLLGAIAGVTLFAVCHRAVAPTMAEAWVFLAVILFRGLSPFHFVPGSTEFTWVPFGATLQGDWQSAFRVLIEKVFYYGTAIWLLRAAGMRLVLSAILVAAVLAFIEIVQIHLPGRTPEITDPILAVLIGFVPAMLSRPFRGRLRTARLE